MPVAAIVLDFDPILRVGDVSVRWQTVALAAVIALSMVLGTIRARRAGLYADDLLSVTVAIVPGAVVGGRIGHVLAHLDFYATRPGAIVDPGQGSLSLGLAVVGGLLTGTAVARLLGTSVGAWLHVLTVPTFLALGLGKLAMVLSGSGQGVPSESAWATAYAGDGPWSTLGPDIASHPAQVYEALLIVGVIVVLRVLSAAGAFGARDGRIFFVALTLWALGRVAVGSVWRDAPVAGPFGVEQLIGLALAVIGVVAVSLLAWRGRPQRRDDRRASGVPEWPDPATRPRF